MGLDPRASCWSRIVFVAVAVLLGGLATAQEVTPTTRAAGFLDAVEKRDWESAAQYVKPSDLTRLRAESERLMGLGRELMVRGAGYWVRDPTEDTGAMPLLYSLLEIAPSLPASQTNRVQYRTVGSFEHGPESFVVIEVRSNEYPEPQLRVLPFTKDDDAWWIAIDYALANSEMRMKYSRQFLVDE